MSECCSNVLKNSYFVKGYLHYSIGQAEIINKNGSLSANKESSLSAYSKGTYYLGRTARFIVSVPGTFIEIALQILQCIPMTFETLLMKLESRVRKIEPKNTCSQFFYDYGLNALIGKFRKTVTLDEPVYLAQDLSLGAYSHDDQINVRWFNFLDKKLFDRK